MNTTTHTLKALQAQADRMRELNAQLDALGAETEALHTAPINREDFKTFLPDLIRMNTSGSRLDNDVSAWLLSPGHETPTPAKSWRGHVFVKRYLPDWMKVLNGASAFALMCWLDPERVKTRLEAFIDELPAGAWGNDEHPSIAQRVDRLKAIEAQTNDLRAQRDAIRQELDRFKIAASGTTGTV